MFPQGSRNYLTYLQLEISSVRTDFYNCVLNSKFDKWIIMGEFGVIELAYNCKFNNFFKFIKLHNFYFVLKNFFQFSRDGIVFWFIILRN